MQLHLNYNLIFICPSAFCMLGYDAMLDKTIKEIDKSLVTFLDRIEREYKMHLVDPILFKSIKDFVLRKGKRIRPMLLIFSYKGYSKRKRDISPSIYQVSTCIELLHNFMLIHDDIIDRSRLRRGKPTMHRLLAKAAQTPDQNRLGCDLGIVAGDIVHAFAIEAFLSTKEDPERKEKALKYFTQTAVFTAMGEFVDTLHSVQKISRITEKDVLLNYSLKTARYTFDCPLVIGAILAGTKEKEIKLLSTLGLLIGQAFQIQDDIIGVFDTQKNIGKSILSDIAECKKTLLVCHAHTVLKSKQRKKFMRYFNKSHKKYADLVAIRKLFMQAGSLQYSLKEIEKRLIQSHKIFKKLKINKKYRKLIEDSFFNLFKPSQRISSKHHIEFNA